MKINILIGSVITFVSLNFISAQTLAANCGTCNGSGSCCYNCSIGAPCNCSQPPAGCNQPCSCPTPCPEPCDCCPKICDCDARLMAYHAGRLIGLYEVSMSANMPNRFACTQWSVEKMLANHDQALADLDEVLARTDSCTHDDILFAKTRGMEDARRLYTYGSADALCQAYLESFNRVAYYECIFKCPEPCAPAPCCEPVSPTCQPLCPATPCCAKPACCDSYFLQSR